MTQFSLTTTWLIEAPLENVWDAIYESERWPSWWPYVGFPVHFVRGVPIYKLNKFNELTRAFLMFSLLNQCVDGISTLWLFVELHNMR